MLSLLLVMRVAQPDPTPADVLRSSVNAADLLRMHRRSESDGVDNRARDGASPTETAQTGRPEPVLPALYRLRFGLGGSWSAGWLRATERTPAAEGQ
jgi:hypothetical protein